MKRSLPWEVILPTLKGTCSADEATQFDAWLMACENNRAIYAELQTLWQEIQIEASGFTPETERCWEELVNRIGTTRPTVTTQPQKSSCLYKYVAAACLLIVLALGGYIALNYEQPVELKYACVDGRSSIVLPDHSSVWLHKGTQLTYTTNGREGVRHVALHGEAYFDVTSDKKRPFVVETQGVRITVHGTKFNVEAFPDSDSLSVSLMSGSVSLQTDTENSRLLPGETAVYNKESNRLCIEKNDDVQFAASWATDRLTFKQQSLHEVCRYLSKWYRVKIDIDPAANDDCLYTFTLRNEALSEILRLMDQIHPMEYTYHEDNSVSIHACRYK